MSAETRVPESLAQPSGHDKFPYHLLRSLYAGTEEDRPRLVAIEAIFKVADDLLGDQLTFAKIQERLLKVKMSDEARGLIPQIFQELRAAVSQNRSEMPKERTLRNIFRKVHEDYGRELLELFHNEEHDFDTRRYDVLELIGEIEDNEQDSYAFIDRRKTTWPDIIRTRLHERITSSSDLAKQPDIHAIADEVLEKLHGRILEFISGSV